MARHLAGAGHDVRAWNRTREKAEGLGATVAASPAEAVDGADVVVTMLSDGPTVAAGDGRHHAAATTRCGGRRARSASTGSRKLGDRLRRRAGARHQPARRAGQADRARERPRARAARRRLRAGLGKVVDLGDEVGTGTRMKLVLQHVGAGARRRPGGDDRARRGPEDRPAAVPGHHRRRADGHAVREAQGQRDDRALVRAELPARAGGQGRRARRRGGRARPAWTSRSRR